MRVSGVRAWVGAVLLVLFAAACGEDRAESEDASTTTSTSIPRVDMDAVYVSTEVPLPPRRSPLVLAAGAHVVVFGGFEINGNEHVSVEDGAVLDATTGQWRPMSEAPFTQPLYNPSGVWTGEEALILGTPCARTSVEMDDARCDPGGVELAAYSPSRDEWRVLPAPTPLASDPDPLAAVGLGWADDRAVYFGEVETAMGEFVLVNPASGASTIVSRPVDSATQCVVDGVVVSVASSRVVSELDVSTRQWSEVTSVPEPSASAPMIERTTCGADALAYVPIQPPPVGLDKGALWWDPKSTMWESLPSFGAIGFAGGANIASTGGTRLFWPAGRSVYLLPAQATAWVPVEPPAVRSGQLQSLGGRVLVNESGAPRTIGILDPNRLLAEQK